MLFNHSPIYVSTALDRLYSSITYPDRIFPKIHTNTWHKDMEPLAAINGLRRSMPNSFVELGSLRRTPNDTVFQRA